MNRTDRPDATRESTDRTMSDVNHTHPYTARGAINRPFERGPVVAADGGRPEAEPAGSATMEDVDHTPPYGEGANRVFQRGAENEAVEE
ncbi:MULTISPECIES: hypothetical protein [Halorussus]|uniref:hypothetical protein n=1 Tax=Halorussus TaxID=1070314 RepID=UPI00209D1D46|nr:hypothetical protein [Halorussus vallis]USZ76232.1 hypothetical protein NGM07_02640 [Halorussus vallis]